MATAFHVGPNQTYTELDQIDFDNLPADSIIYLYWRNTPYKKGAHFNVSTNFFTLQGVAGQNGLLPVLMGDGATARKNALFIGQEGSAAYENLGLIMISRHRSQNYYYAPKNITLKDVVICSTYKCPWTNSLGAPETRGFVCGVWASGAIDNFVVDNVTFIDNANGLFLKPEAGLANKVVVQNCKFYWNGEAGKFLCHHSYMEAFEDYYYNNYYGPMRATTGGGCLKTRSAYSEIKGNTFDTQASTARHIDKVEMEAGKVFATSHPNYRKAVISGNFHVIETTMDAVHVGGDNWVNPDTTYVNQCLYEDNKVIFWMDTVDFKRTDPNYKPVWGYDSIGYKANLIKTDIAGTVIDFKGNNVWVLTKTPKTQLPVVLLENGAGQLNLLPGNKATTWGDLIANPANISAQDLGVPNLPVCPINNAYIPSSIPPLVFYRQWGSSTPAPVTPAPVTPTPTVPVPTTPVTETPKPTGTETPVTTVPGTEQPKVEPKPSEPVTTTPVPTVPVPTETKPTTTEPKPAPVVTPPTPPTPAPVTYTQEYVDNLTKKADKLQVELDDVKSLLVVTQINLNTANDKLKTLTQDHIYVKDLLQPVASNVDSALKKLG